MLHLHFLRTPAEVVAGEDGGVAPLRLQKTRLEAAAKPGGDQRAVGTGTGAGVGCRCAGTALTFCYHLP